MNVILTFQNMNDHERWMLEFTSASLCFTSGKTQIWKQKQSHEKAGKETAQKKCARVVFLYRHPDTGV